MAGQNGDSKAPRQAVVPPEPGPPARRLESRVPTLPPQAPAQPKPLVAGIDRAAGIKPSQSTVPGRTRPRITRISEYLAELRRMEMAQSPPPAARFDRDTYEFMQGLRGKVQERREPMDWSGIGCVKEAPAPHSLVDTLTNGFPAAAEVPAGAPPGTDGLLSKELWVEAGLPRLRKKKPASIDEPPDIKKRLDQWCLSLDHPAKEVLLNSLIEDAVSEFSALKRASKGLVTVCSGGRPDYLLEAEVGAPVGNISAQFLRKMNTMRKHGILPEADAKALVEQLVRFVFHNPGPVEGPGITEAGMRNGFFRAVTWCICTCTNPSLFQEFFSKNNILLIDAVGIAAGLNSDEARAVMGDAGVRSALYRLLKKRWVATGFEHLKETLRADSARGLLDPRAAFHFTTVLFREAGEYQRIVQSYSILARNMSNLKVVSPSRGILYLSEREFIACLRSRGNLQPRLRAGIDRMHEFIAGLFAGRAKGSGQEEHQYAVGRSPAEISGIFNTVLEGLDFFIGDPKMRRMALEAIQHYGIGGGEGQPASFKKIFALCLFTRYRDVQDYGRLFRLLFDYSDPIVSDLALDHAAWLLAQEANFILLREEKPRESAATLSPEDLAQILAEGDSPF
ncbi:MAG: hypothetical protein AB1657_04500 [Candidatus Micrarchaeota archaeon]